MNLFYHHVGQYGASIDFPKTILNRVPIETVGSSVPAHIPMHAEIVNTLRKQFPDGTFNCWGIPAGAKTIIRSLEVGDAILLIETTQDTGRIPVLGIVKAYWNIQIPELSRALWGNNQFPYIFFFDTELLDLTWVKFLDEIGYAKNFDPRGMFLKLNDERLAAYGGATGYVNLLREIHGTKDLSHFGEWKPNSTLGDKYPAVLEMQKQNGFIFLSYAREDKDRVLVVYRKIIEKGYDVWMDDKKLLPGQNWEFEIQKAIRQARVFIACLSKNSVSKKGYFQQELKNGLEVYDEFPEGQIFMIPLLLDSCDVPSRFRKIQWCDINAPEGIEKLFLSIKASFSG